MVDTGEEDVPRFSVLVLLSLWGQRDHLPAAKEAVGSCA